MSSNDHQSSPNSYLAEGETPPDTQVIVVGVAAREPQEPKLPRRFLCASRSGAKIQDGGDGEPVLLECP